IITVFGTSKTQPGEPEFETAKILGRLLAKKGFTIANGGYSGTMLATAQGAAEADGQVIGVTCRAFKRGKANPYISREIQTNSLTERLAILVELGKAYIVLPGGTGTLLELADVWEHKNKGFSNAEKPIILMGAFWKPLLEMMGRADAESLRSVDYAEGPEEAAAIITAKLSTKQVDYA
ncbi:MAG TPA: LOG family protein, partial [Anaerohalosphaeraceae bacterium]|nr:LOG family protein [Anaerohalosphaeraceae bacterium]